MAGLTVPSSSSAFDSALPLVTQPFCAFFKPASLISMAENKNQTLKILCVLSSPRRRKKNLNVKSTLCVPAVIVLGEGILQRI